MQIRHIVYGLTLLTGLVFTMGCKAPLGDQAFYDHYDQQFRERVAYVAHHIPVGQHQLYAREFGADHQGGPLVVMMHGFPDNLHLYDRLVPLLAASHHVVTFDFLGWGKSDKPAGMTYGFPGLKRDLQAVLDYFNAADVVLVVHDLSGLPGIEWALHHEGQVRALILLNTVYSPVDALRSPEAIERYSTPGRLRDFRVWLAKRGDWKWQLGVERQVASFMVTEDARQTFVKLFGYQALGIRDAFFDLNRALREEVRSKTADIPRLKQFTKPVHIIFGAADLYLNVEVARAYHALFTGSRLSLVDHAGHYVQLDQPEQVATLILETMR